MTEVSVYLIACGDRVKVGISNDPANRLKAMATGMPDPPILVASRKFESRAIAREIERELHWRFRQRRVRGEWFAVGVREARGHLAQVSPPKQRTPYEASKLIAEMFDAEAEAPKLV